jgi:nicotinate-nucleotide adenylyltransferase
LLGADSFLTLKSWHRCAELLVFCNFIVAGRPGFSLQEVNAALPEGVENTCERREDGYTRFTLSGASGRSSELFLLPDLDQDISATEIRAALAEGSTPQTVLPSVVADYIRVHRLYRQVEIP